MDFSEVLRTDDAAPPAVLVGRILTAPAEGPLPTLGVEIHSAEGGNLLAVGNTLRSGSFVIEIPAESVGATVVVSLVDAEGTTLKTVRAEADSRVVHLRVPRQTLSDAQPVPVDRPVISLLPRVQEVQLRARIDSLIASDELPESSRSVYDTAVGSVRWLEDLVPDAELTLAGNEDSALRLRRTLLPLGENARARGGDGNIVPLLTAPPSARAAVAILASAALWSADDFDEAQVMLEGLSDAVTPRHWIELLLDEQLQAPSMRFLMSGPAGFGGFDRDFGSGPAGGEVPNIKVPSTGVIPGLKGPPSLEGLLNKKPKIVFDPLVPGGLRPDTPVLQRTCVEWAIDAAAKASALAPRWRITDLSNRVACPGSELTLFGEGFSIRGSVFFTGSDGEVEAQNVSLWTATKITVEVPAEARPGPIRLSILATTIASCGAGRFPVFRRGGSDVEFVGGIPEVKGLGVISGTSWSSIVAPNTDALIWVSTSSGEGIIVNVDVKQAGTTIRSFAALPGGDHTLIFRTPASASAIQLEVVATVLSWCGNSQRRVTLTVGHEPHLRIRGIELVQAIQSPDPLQPGAGSTAVRLVAQKRTAVRVYVESGLPPAGSYGLGPGEIPITGTANLFGTFGGVYGIQRLSTQLSPAAARPAATRDNAIEFELPWEMLDGDIRVEVTVRPNPVLPLPVDFAASKASISATFVRRGQQVLVPILIRDDLHPPPKTTTPTIDDWRATLVGAKDRLPLAEDGFIEAVAPGLPVPLGTKRDLTMESEWQKLLDDIDELCREYYNPTREIIWAAITPPSPEPEFYGLRGISHNYHFDSGVFQWPAYPIDLRVMIAQAGLRSTFAHEMTHLFKIDHSACGNPERLDSRLPSETELGAVCWRASDDVTFVAPSPELMGYCGVPIDGSNELDREGRMPSIACWDIVFDALK